MLLEKEERARIKGLIINKFRGDKSILDPGIEMLEERVGYSGGRSYAVSAALKWRTRTA